MENALYGKLVSEFANKDGSTTFIYLDGNSMLFVKNDKIVASIPLEDADEALEAAELDA